MEKADLRRTGSCCSACISAFGMRCFDFPPVCRALFLFDLQSSYVIGICAPPGRRSTHFRGDRSNRGAYLAAYGLDYAAFWRVRRRVRGPQIDVFFCFVHRAIPLLSVVHKTPALTNLGILNWKIVLFPAAPRSQSHLCRAGSNCWRAAALIVQTAPASNHHPCASFRSRHTNALGPPGAKDSLALTALGCPGGAAWPGDRRHPSEKK